MLVTGASSGIGKETSILLSQLGARVILVARRVDALQEALAELAPGEHLTESFDLMELDGVKEWMTGIAARVGPLDGLVHCAGVAPVLPLPALSYDRLEPVLRLNVGAAIALARGFCQRTVRAKSGSIVFLSSVSSLVGDKALTAYSASKGALDAAVRSLALELAPQKIRINTVAPGFVPTPLYSEGLLGAAGVDAEAWLSEMARRHPLGLGTTRDVAHAVAFLLADTGRWITGSTLLVDGGFCAG